MNTPFDITLFLNERQQGVSRSLASGLFSPDLAGHLRGSVRLLGGSPVLLALASDPPPSSVVVDEARMSVTLPVSTCGKDRMGDIVEPRGCLPHLKNYERNPRVFFSHRSTDHPIGSARNPDTGELALWVSDDCITSTCYFHGETPESEVIFRLVKRKELQAASIGFLPVVASILKRKKGGGGNEDNDHGEKVINFGDMFPALRFSEWDLTEWSIVPIPANPEACESLTVLLEKGDVEGERIPASIKKALEPFKLKVRMWSPGFNPESAKFTGVLALGEREVEYTEGKLVRLDNHKFTDGQTTDDKSKDEVIEPLLNNTVFLPVVAEADGDAQVDKEAPTLAPVTDSPLSVTPQQLEELVALAVKKTLSTLDDTVGGALVGGNGKPKEANSPPVVESQEHAREEMAIMKETLELVKALVESNAKEHQEILRCMEGKAKEMAAMEEKDTKRKKLTEEILSTQEKIQGAILRLTGKRQ